MNKAEEDNEDNDAIDEIDDAPAAKNLTYYH